MCIHFLLHNFSAKLSWYDKESMPSLYGNKCESEANRKEAADFDIM